jgi:hypothetical protein
MKKLNFKIFMTFSKKTENTGIEKFSKTETEIPKPTKTYTENFGLKTIEVTLIISFLYFL